MRFIATKGLICTACAMMFAGCVSPPQNEKTWEPPSPSSAHDNRSQTAAVQVRRLGSSIEGRPLVAYEFGREGPATLILGAFHGDEPQTVFVAERLVEHLRERPSSYTGQRVVVVPQVNPDGYARRTRRNANRVDVNRNFPASNWQNGPMNRRFYGGPHPSSEPETRVVIDLVERYLPKCIVSMHTIDHGKHCNNFDGPGQGLAEAMARFNGYPPAGSMGYPTPGSFGTWAGIDRGIATLTLEMPSSARPQRLWEENKEALLAAIRWRP